MDTGFAQGHNCLPHTGTAKESASDEIRTPALIDSLFNKWAVGSSGGNGMLPKELQDGFGFLPIIPKVSHQTGVAAVLMIIQFFKRLDNSRSQWIERYIADQLQKIDILLTKNRLVAVLK